MTRSEIRLAVFDEHKQELQETFKNKWEQNDLLTFQFLSANLSKCMPDIPVEEHKSIYFDVMATNILQHIDTQFCDQFNNIDDVNEFNYEEIKKSLPAMFISYHLGSYRSALAFLVKHNIDVVLIADPLAYKLYLQKMQDQFQTTIKAFNSTSNVVIYPADRPDLTLQMMDKMKNGYSVLAFIDGNSGANGYFNRDNTLKISFLGQDIFVKTGLPMLSFYLKCPIIPMISFYDENLKPRWKIYDPIYPVKGEKRPTEYVKSCLEYLYSILETALQKHYAQWEGWMFLHRNIDMNNFTQTFENKEVTPSITNVTINPNIGLFSAEGKHYALNKDNYKILEITKEMFISFDKKKLDTIYEKPEYDIHLLYKNGFLKDKPLQIAC